MKRSFIFASAIILLLAASLRIYHLGRRSLWLDEALAANISRGTLSETLTLTRGFHSAPILHPLILFATEKISSGPFAVRFPAFIASLLAVALVLGFVFILSVDRRTAALAALMLAVSAPQIRYAQEVREYSLGVLYAVVLIYVFLSYLSSQKIEPSPAPMCLAMFAAPLVQYGLVLFGVGVLLALFLLELAGRRRSRRFVHIFLASGCFGLGGLLSYFLTLRYQWEETAFYLKEYFWTPGMDPLRFVLANTHHLFTSLLLPGLGAAVISVLAILIYIGAGVRSRILSPLAVLACTTLGTALAFAFLHKYPYGPIRQCLYLAPVLCLFASQCLVEVAGKFRGRIGSFLFAGILAIILVSGIFQIRSANPYAEVEDMQKILLYLRGQMAPGDNVYVYSSAVPAADFYIKPRDSRFLYGNYHREAPQEYAVELQQGLAPGTKKVWILFCHIYQDEDQRIVHDLDPAWNIALEVASRGCSLYIAVRRAGTVVDASALPSPALSPDQASNVLASHTHDSFWEWNFRNSRPSIH